MEIKSHFNHRHVMILLAFSNLWTTRFPFFNVVFNIVHLKVSLYTVYGKYK